MEKLLVIRVINRVFLLVIFFLLSFIVVYSQDKKLEFTLDGYLVYLPSIDKIKDSSLTNNNIIHNRINLRSYFSEHFTVSLRLRIRLFFGESVKKNSLFGQYLNKDDGIVDMSFLWIDGNTLKAHTMIDRLWLNYKKGKWEFSIGRQRVNWGVNLLWNSNDLFNAYNFTDFDYVERPGSDVIRFQYYGDDLSSIDFVFKPTNNNGYILAGLYKFNKKGYDFQFLGANYFDDIALGTGWAGNLKNAGFKGEMTYFIDKNSNKNSLSVSTSIDYSFKDGFYLNVGYLYNSNGFTDSNILRDVSFLQSSLSPKNLMPSKISYFSQVSKQVNPALNSSMSLLYGQGVNILFFMTNISYSFNNDMDLDLIGQFYFGENPIKFENILKNLNVRFRYNY